MGLGNRNAAPLVQPPPAATVDPAFSGAVDQANKIASDYAANIPTFAAQTMGIVGNQARQALGSALAQNTQSANSRGFLYSGLKQGADQASQGDYAGNLATARTSVNQNLQNNSNDLNQQAVNIGSQVANAQQNYTAEAQKTQQDVVNMELQQQQAAANNYAQAGSGLGSAIGTGVGLLAGGTKGASTAPVNTSVNSYVAPASNGTPTSNYGGFLA